MANPVQINDSLFTAGLVLSAQEARGGQSAFVAHDGAGPRLGVFYEGTQNLITGTATTSPSMQVSVAPLAFCGQKALAEGVYVGRSPGTVLVDIAAAPASNSRIDTVYVMQRDQNSTTSPDANTQGEVGVITGTAAVSPTAPSAPAGAVALGTVTVAAGVTATTNAGCTIATTAQWTTGAGSAIPVRNATERNALTAFDGLAVYRLDLHSAEVYNGSSWGVPFISVAQTVTSTPPTQNVWTVLGWNSVVENDGFTYSGGVFTAPVAGVYAITVQYTFTSSSPVVQIGAALADNSTPPVPYRRNFNSSMTGANAAVALTVEYRLTAGQQFTLPVITAASAHALEVAANGAGTFATVRWVRD